MFGALASRLSGLEEVVATLGARLAARERSHRDAAEVEKQLNPRPE